MTTGGDVEVAVKTRTEAKAVELNRARVESLLKPDAGRDDIFHAAGQGLTEIGGARTRDADVEDVDRGRCAAKTVAARRRRETEQRASVSRSGDPR